MMISEKYLESIVKALVKDGVLIGLRGKGGGYRLSKAPDQFVVGDILRLMEGTLAPVACLDKNSPPCSRVVGCRTLPLWQGLDQVISEYLDKFTLEDLMAKDNVGYDYII